MLGFFDGNTPENIAYCSDFVSGLRDLIIYSHVPTALIAVAIALTAYSKDHKSLLSKILAGIALSFFTWSMLDLSIWLNFDKASVLMFSWSLIEIVSVLIFALSAYFAYVFTRKKDLGIAIKIGIFALIAPIVIVAPTSFNLVRYSMPECVAVENPVFLQYVLVLKILFTAAIVFLLARAFFAGTRDERRQVSILSLGMLFFIFSFLISGYVSELTENYTYEIYGLFGMLVFIGALSYLIVRFRTFNIRIIGAQAIVAFLVALIAAQYAFLDEPQAIALNAATVAISLVLGYILVRSVKKEIVQRERIEKLANDLEAANGRLTELDRLKSEFLSFASHQIRSPLTAIKGYTSMIKEGDFGPVPEKVAEAVSVIDTSAQSLIVIVGEFLDISRIEQGRMKYEMSSFDLTELVREVAAEQRPTVESHNLSLVLDVTDESRATRSDKGKVKQIIGNIIDNAIKYTPAGSITVTLSSTAEAYKVTVSDTGVGMTEETLAVLFTKFGRAADARKTNVSGTGLGLYVAKQMAEALGGSVSAMSEGTGKGSRFVLTLPRK